MLFAAVHESLIGRFCCKSLFAQMITNFPSCRRGFRVNMLGTSSHSDELTGDFGNEPEAILIGDHGLSRLLAEKLSPRDLGLLQQNRHIADNPSAPAFVRFRTTADNGGFWPATVCPLLTHKRHWLCNAAMVLMPVSAPFKVLV